MKLRRLKTTDAGFDATLEALTRYEAAQDEKIEAAARGIIADVRQRGDAALLEYTRKFDRLQARNMAELDVPRAKLDAALAALPAAQEGEKNHDPCPLHHLFLIHVNIICCIPANCLNPNCDDSCPAIRTMASPSKREALM
jgi:hypothetical protein